MELPQNYKFNSADGLWCSVVAFKLCANDVIHSDKSLKAIHMGIWINDNHSPHNDDVSQFQLHITTLEIIIVRGKVLITLTGRTDNKIIIAKYYTSEPPTGRTRAESHWHNRTNRDTKSNWTASERNEYTENKMWALEQLKVQLDLDIEKLNLCFVAFFTHLVTNRIIALKSRNN